MPSTLLPWSIWQNAVRQEAAVFIHLSTDFVFGGVTDRPYTEEDIPAPVNYYGYTKLEGEKRIAAVLQGLCHRAHSGGVRCRPARTAWKCAPTGGK